MTLFVRTSTKTLIASLADCDQYALGTARVLRELYQRIHVGTRVWDHLGAVVVYDPLDDQIEIDGLVMPYRNAADYVDAPRVAETYSKLQAALSTLNIRMAAVYNMCEELHVYFWLGDHRCTYHCIIDGTALYYQDRSSIHSTYTTITAFVEHVRQSDAYLIYNRHRAVKQFIDDTLRAYGLAVPADTVEALTVLFAHMHYCPDGPGAEAALAELRRC